MNPERYSITEAMLHFLVQHRTEYKGLGIEAAGARYAADIEATFQLMLPFLPETAESVVDVGGGLGGMALRLARHYGPGCRVIVYDRTGDAGSKIGWHSSAADFGAYNNLQLTSQFLEGNGCENFAVGDADADLFPGGPHQLVISLLSMGFHYPVETYLQEIHASLVDGGVLMFDARKGRDISCVAEKFNSRLLALHETDKHALIGVAK